MKLGKENAMLNALNRLASAVDGRGRRDLLWPASHALRFIIAPVPIAEINQ
jgi:hypothetical protein